MDSLCLLFELRFPHLQTKHRTNFPYGFVVQGDVGFGQRLALWVDTEYRLALSHTHTHRQPFFPFPMECAGPHNHEVFCHNVARY